jgi:SAM-dependent methyltransferase
MGINTETAAFLCEARGAGASFGRVLTLGRQNLNADRAALAAIGRRDRVDPERAAAAAAGEYAEGFFKAFLGAERVDSIDNSEYEGAALRHDLNVPVPAEWERQYDAVVDGGTLEHVFNFPAAIANCMRMVRTGGRLFIFTPANNQLGHGFYQFSPELFFRTLARERGFEIERMVAVQFRYSGTEYGAMKHAYRVADPAAVGSRITLVNSRPVTLMIQALKVEHRGDPFETFPQQSDYSEIWKAGDRDAVAVARPLRDGLLGKPARLVRKMLPRAVGERLRNEYDRHFVHSFRNRAFYEPVER